MMTVSLSTKLIKLTKIKKINLNCSKLRFSEKINLKLEKYLIETNKKVLIISKNNQYLQINFYFAKKLLIKVFLLTSIMTSSTDLNIF